MDIYLEVYDYLCAPSSFFINGKQANISDFGSQGDTDSEHAEDYGCGNMEFTGSLPSKEILIKYGITEQEYAEIVAELEKKLSFGACGLCA